MTNGRSVEPRRADHPDWERDRPSQRWWQGTDGYWYPPAAERGAPRSALMVAGPRLSPAARADQDGGGAPPSPPSTSLPLGGRGTRGGTGRPHGFTSAEQAADEELASRERHPTSRPFGLRDGDLARARRRVAALAPWAASRSARSGPTLGMQAEADSGPTPAIAEGTPDRVLPLWLCIGVPLAIVLIAFVAIAVFTAPTGTDSLPSGSRVETDGGEDGGRSLPTAEPLASEDGAARGDASTTTVAPTTTSTTDEPEATTTTAEPADEAPPTTAAESAAPAPAPEAAAPAPGDEGAASPEPEVGVLPLVEAVTGSGCHPSYAPCVPVAEDVDCYGQGDGPEYVRHVRVLGPDEYDLDPDGNGVGCD